MKYLSVLATLTLLFSGCGSSKPSTPKAQNAYQKSGQTYSELNQAIVAIADQLLKSNDTKNKKTKVILTSFVDLNNLDRTTTLGRLLSESMFNELYIRKFKVVDFRGEDAVTVNKDGEFHITRDVDRLKDHIEAAQYVVVGTYVKFESDSVLINARIIDAVSGVVVSSARVIYKPTDCTIYNICGSGTSMEGLKVISRKRDMSSRDCVLGNDCTPKGKGVSIIPDSK